MPPRYGPTPATAYGRHTPTSPSWGQYGQAALYGVGQVGEGGDGYTGATTAATTAAGAAIGFAFGGPAGAAVGAAIGKFGGQVLGASGKKAQARHKAREARIQATRQEAMILNELSAVNAATATSGYASGFVGGWGAIQRANQTQAALDIRAVRETASARARAYIKQGRQQFAEAIFSGIEGGAKTLAGGAPTLGKGG